MSLHVPSFQGGVVQLGSPDTEQTSEVQQADSVDIGPRGQLICTTDVSDYLTVDFVGALVGPLRDVYGITDVALGSGPQLLVVGRGRNLANSADAVILSAFTRSGAGPIVAGAPSLTTVPPAAGLIMTAVQFPGVYSITAGASTYTGSLVLVCAGAREGTFPRSGGPLTALIYDVAGATINVFSLNDLDALGTGQYSKGFPTGTKGKALYPRGIVGYNNHVFAYGFDNADATNGDGPTRVMFCNAGNPLKWGNDNIATSGDRDYTDSDAIVLGDAGEIIRGALSWNGRLYFGTNQQLHYIAGYGRDSFLTDGANPVAKSYNIVGPRALKEGPDKLLYQVSDQGLVAFDGASFEPHFKRLVDFPGHSSGYWDLIWTDPTLGVGFPGRTNADLVWMEVDWDREQIVIGIPFCNLANGAGPGTDTAILKFHTRSGGFTRQVFPGVAYSAAGYFRREGQQREVRILATATTGKVTVQRYGYQATQSAAPVLPTALPVVRFGPYAPFGPDGDGVVRRLYLQLAWEASGSLPLVFNIFTLIDECPCDTFVLSVQPTAPVLPGQGDVWVDTSQTDTNLGNATAGVLVPATGGYLVRTFDGAVWRLIPGSGEQGTRGRIPLPLTRRTGGRMTIVAQCTAAAGRFQIEGLGINPGDGSHDA